MDRIFLMLAGLFGALGVALGAFGAHALRERLAADMLATFETGVRYQLYHALALVAVMVAVARWPESSPAVAAGMSCAARLHRAPRAASRAQDAGRAIARPLPQGQRRRLPARRARLAPVPTGSPTVPHLSFVPDSSISVVKMETFRDTVGRLRQLATGQ